MNVLVLVKQIPDPNNPYQLANNRLKRDGGQNVLDPGDEFGVEAALQLTEANGGEVTVVSMGPESALEAIERKHGKARRIWVFDRGVVSEANLEKLRQRGAQYVVGTPRSQLKQYEQQLLQGEWQDISKEVKVQLLAQGQETFVLARSEDRASKEQAMRWRQVRGLMRDLVCLRRSIGRGLIKDPDKILMRVGRLAERWSRAWAYLTVKWEADRLSWRWDREALRLAALRDGAYLLRTNLKERTPEALWKMYVQLSEVESVFRAMKSQLAIRPIWHWVGPRVEAHVMVAFLGYCLWVCLKQKLKAVAPSLTPWQLLDQFGRIVQVEVWFKLRAGGAICLPRITQPEPAQAILLHQLGWSLPEQPPPKIYKDQVPDVWTT